MEESKDPARFAVIGCGLTGKAWAKLFVSKGYGVGLYDVIPSKAEQVAFEIKEEVTLSIKQDLQQDNAGSPQTIGLITAFPDLASCTKDVVYIQECIPDEIALKTKLFQDLADITDEDVIIASGTGNIPPSLFTEAMPMRREQCLAAHADNAFCLPLVELVRSNWTKDEVLNKTKRIIEGCGKTVVVLKKEVPGFVYNRMHYTIVQEALKSIKDNVISPEDADKATVYGIGMRWSIMGPLETEHLTCVGGLGETLATYGDMIYEVSSDLGRAESLIGSDVMTRISESDSLIRSSSRMQCRREEVEKYLTAFCEMKKMW